MLKALWLTSWYPNKLDAQNGDFIQRHAMATALFCKVHVIHLEVYTQNLLSKTEVSVTKKDNLTEEIVLYKPYPQKNIAGRLLSYRRYTSLFKKHIKAYIQQYGVPDVVHVHVPIRAGMPALWLKRTYNIPYVVTEHWAIYNNDAPDAFAKRSFFFKRLTKKILQNAALFTPVSRDLGEAVQKLVVNIPFTVVPNVVDTKLFNPGNPPPKNSGAFVFIHVSTLNYQKNPEAILRAFSRVLQAHPRAQLVMTGNAPAALIEYASTLRIPSANISFSGLIPYNEVAKLMKASDALVMFSRYENLPCVITEALCCGLPVISARTGGIAEVVNSTNGLLVNTGDEQALLQAMLQVCGKTGVFNGHTIAASAAVLFAYNTIGKNIAALYTGLLVKHVTLENKQQQKK